MQSTVLNMVCVWGGGRKTGGEREVTCLLRGRQWGGWVRVGGKQETMIVGTVH